MAEERRNRARRQPIYLMDVRKELGPLSQEAIGLLHVADPSQTVEANSKAARDWWAQANWNANYVVFIVCGSTQHLYEVVITAEDGAITCTCPDHIYRRTTCKHMYYALDRLGNWDQAEKLYEGYREGSIAMAPEELQKQYEKLIADPVQQKEVNGDCPICAESMLDGDLLYCKSMCGQSVHRKCWEKWSEYKKRCGNVPTCVYCRSVWHSQLQL